MGQNDPIKEDQLLMLPDNKAISRNGYYSQEVQRQT